MRAFAAAVRFPRAARTQKKAQTSKQTDVALVRVWGRARARLAQKSLAAAFGNENHPVAARGNGFAAARADSGGRAINHLRRHTPLGQNAVGVINGGCGHPLIGQRRHRADLSFLWSSAVTMDAIRRCPPPPRSTLSDAGLIAACFYLANCNAGEMRADRDAYGCSKQPSL